MEILDSPEMLTSAVRCSPQESFNLLVAMALWAEMSIDPGELRADVLVVAARPQPKLQAPVPEEPQTNWRTEMPKMRALSMCKSIRRRTYLVVVFLAT